MTRVVCDLKQKPVSPVLIAGVVALAALAINGVIPAAELIQADLGTLDGGLPRIVGALTAGYALGQLVLSVIVDGRDKQRMSRNALVIFALSSIGAAVSVDWSIHLLMRFMQGVCASTGAVVGRAIVMSLGDYEKSAKTLSSASALFTWAPVLAPLIGSVLAENFGWRSFHLALGAYAMILAIVVARAPSAWFHREGTSVPKHEGLVALAKRNSFLIALLVGPATFSGAFAYFVVADRLSVDSMYGSLSLSFAVATMAGSYALGTLVSTALHRSLKSVEILWFSSISMVFFGAVASYAVFANDGRFFIAAAICHAMSAGAAFPNANMLAMRDADCSPAMATGLFGCARMVAATMVAFTASAWQTSSPVFYATLMLVCSMLCLFAMSWFRHFDH